MGLDAAWGTPKLYHSDEHLELWVSKVLFCPQTAP